MLSDQKTNYIGIFIRYRIVLAIACTAVYLFAITRSGNNTLQKLGIAFGMLTACFLAVFLYWKIFSQMESKLWTLSVFCIELFTYGVFTFLSGGFSSPYFWYYMGYLITSMAVHDSLFFTILGVIWCLCCAIASGTIAPQEMMNMELNLAMGSVIMAGTFYILLHYLKYVMRHQELYKAMNASLQHEKERSEQALQHATSLYDAINLFAMTNPDKIMEELADTFRDTIAPEGCILAKLCSDGTVENQMLRDMEAQHASLLVDLAISQWSAQRRDGMSQDIWRDMPGPDGSAMFESTGIGTFFSLQGVVIRKKIDRKTVEVARDDFYCGLAEMIFRNLDIQKQLEEYIIAEEQSRLANGIHDTVIQKLFGIACSLKLLENDIEALPPGAAAQRIREIKRSSELTMKELREAIYGLDFSDGETFRHKLKRYMEEVEHLTESKVQLSLDDHADMMTTAQKVAVYRISCEAVNNAVRHGKAACVDVEIRLDPNAVWVKIADNGTGAGAQAKTITPGNGLKNMRHMVSMLGGTLELALEAKGAIVQFMLPR